MRRSLRLAVVTLLGVSLLSRPVLAHGFGSRYELSLPRWLFIGGGALVVVFSFILVSVFAGRERGAFEYTSGRLSETPLGVVIHPGVVGLARAGAVVLLVGGVAIGFVGPQESTTNLYTLLVWVVWWVAYTFSVIFVGNTWPVLNPWKTLYEAGVDLFGRDPSLDREYTWGALPALAAFFGFAWLEIVSPVSRSPRGMALLTLLYSAYIWGGMLVFGAETWLENADPFTRLYRYLGRFAPLARTDDDDVEVRLYGVGLVDHDDTLHVTGGLVFLVAILYTVTFDGFLVTPEWRSLARGAPTLPVPRATTALLMLSGLAVFVLAYYSFAVAMKGAAGTALASGYLARRFALSVLPIAIAYHVSHFYTFLLIQSQFLLVALADPFGLGWNLFGLGSFEPSTGVPFLSVGAVWQSQVAMIVIGHVIAVWAAHHVALEEFTDRWQAVKSQVPMLALMVLYTMLSLWILTRPVVTPPLP